MNTAEQVLVIFLSTALGIFLVLSIIVLTYLIQIMKTVKRITVKAEELADKAGQIGDMVKQAAGPTAVGRVLVNLADSVFKRNKS